ncbi:MAG: hypothetical protein CMJ64_01760 [Planctomycetaceae bacterium]|nr:hypothetical protein [Planctomycetaceae bacterium]
MGRVHYAIHPDNPRNKEIIDLQHAPRDSKGLVTFASDLYILAPMKLAKGNQALLYDVNNRGNKLALRFFNDAPGGNAPNDAGNGYLLRKGYTIVWSGWDGELLPGGNRLQLFAPVATNDKEPITGLVRYELCPDKETDRLPVNKSNHGAYRPTARGFAGATLTWRLTPLDKRVPIPHNQFRLHLDEVENAEPGQLPKVELELRGGFRPGYLYEVIYEAQDPLVHGVCFASVRDLIAAFKQGEGDKNPLLLGDQPVIKRAHGFGVSQSGRFLREYLYSGFNADTKGRPVFDGLIPHVAGGGLGSFNHRFAQPTAYATQHELWDFGTDRFPFAYEMQTDSLSKRHDGILRRATESLTAPKIMHTQSSTEYWTRSGSLVHTDTLGRKDAELPDNVRVYAFGGTQHGPASFPPSQGKGQTLANPGDYKPFLRSLLSALDRWCRDNTPPPASVYPMLRDGTLRYFTRSSTRFPAIPGIRYPEVMNEPNLLDFGKRWHAEGIIDLQPPRLSGRYAALVPGSGKDGNDLGCLLPPEVAVPLATFTGWSLRRADAGPENELVGLNGSYIPFPATKADRDASGDPRLSLEERYGSQEKYLADLKRYCQQLAADGYLLEEDVPRIMKQQEQRSAERFAASDNP